MKRFTILAAGVLLAVLFAPTISAPAGAQATTDVYVVHGLNLSFQESQDAGGTSVTVCAGDTSLIPDFQFGDVVGPVALPSGGTVPVSVYLGAEVDCADPGDTPLVIGQDVTPEGAAVALVATAGPEQDPALAPFALDVACADAGDGRLTGAHAANAPEVDVTVAGGSVGSLAFGESLTAPLPADTYDVAVLLGDTPIVEAPIPVEDAVHTAIFVVGNQPVDGNTPVVPLALTIDLAVCETPAVPTTPTTAAPAAAAASAQPSFTG